eukprot:g3294.t1
MPSRVSSINRSHKLEETKQSSFFYVGAVISGLVLLLVVYHNIGGNISASSSSTSSESVAEKPVDMSQIRNPFASLSGSQARKGMWPELKDSDVDTAVQVIKSQRPDLRTVVKLPEGSMVTKDYRLDRVRVYYDTSTNKVTKAPMAG